MVIAVIGKRDASARYLEIARRIGRILAQKGITVLNGLALGIDTAALEGAVELNGKAIAVMPGGLDEIYPKKNQELAERILKNGGCLIRLSLWAYLIIFISGICVCLRMPGNWEIT